MLSTAQALGRILALMTVTGTETVPLRQANGRVLAETLVAKLSQPPFAASAMDGYALRNADAQTGRSLQIIGESRAGARFAGQVRSGQAVRIFTGAPLPAGADRVVIQEDTDRDGGTISIRPNLDDRTYVRAAGLDFVQGQHLVGQKRLNPNDIALLAAMNIARVVVRRRPVIAVIATGDELVMPGSVPGPDQLISSNNFGIAALLEQHGARVRMLPIARDTLASLEAAFAFATGADLIVTLGGASVGDHDLVGQAAAARGMVADFWKVAIRPGKPLLAGKIGNTPLIGLPGNPVSAMVGAHVFLRPALNAMLGLPAGPLPRNSGRLASALPANGPREHYLRGTATWSGAGWSLDVESNQDSALLSVLARSNALIVAAPNQPARPEQSIAEFILL